MWVYHNPARYWSIQLWAVFWIAIFHPWFEEGIWVGIVLVLKVVSLANRTAILNHEGQYYTLGWVLGEWNIYWLAYRWLCQMNWRTNCIKYTKRLNHLRQVISSLVHRFGLFSWTFSRYLESMIGKGQQILHSLLYWQSFSIWTIIHAGFDGFLF